MTPARAGAVAIIHLDADEPAGLDAIFEALCPGRGSIAIGAIVLREIRGVDHVVVARINGCVAEVMPHGGSAAVAATLRRLREIGATDDAPATRALYPEAASCLEAEMLATLAQAASSAAVDVLLAQPVLWAAEIAGVGLGALPPAERTDRDRVLDRLVTPATVAAWGPPNIGKSTLCNALAQRDVSIVADEPGTTRDHVGVMLDLGGVAVRYLDTPGVRPGAEPLERDAAAISAGVLASADLILLCHDPMTAPLASPAPDGVPTLRVMLRADLGAAADGSIAVSCRTGTGIEALAEAIRAAIMPISLTPPPKWRFWRDSIGF